MHRTTLSIFAVFLAAYFVANRMMAARGVPHATAGATDAKETR